ncbi:hypothetical protein [Enterovirga aerilata]|uniref:Uncharacterized protein n=1 Tax=Enterovirga aerilata TaxID=2730920 RepID=A0A849IFU0_9HYPH|nr:hypothetical protein [Enterovirga sp. DB1703]NNM75085.1 hypothetical protein [Enterovirga sp. DB1703]
MTDRYLWHLTLDTGHGRRSYRDEVSDAVVTTLRQQISEMLAGLPVEVLPGYRLTGTAAGGALLATVESETAGPLATVAVAPSGRSSTRLWQELSKPAPAGGVAVGEAPEPPWCAVRLYPGLGRDPDAAHWLGDFERCLAWAWIEGKG